MSANGKPATGFELRSMVKPEGVLELSFAEVSIPDPAPGEIVVRVEATPVNPSDMSLMLGAANPSDAVAEGDGWRRKLTMPLPPGFVAAMARRHNLSICPGLEGAGIVIAAGEGCDNLLGKTVAMFGGKIFAQYRVIKPADCIIFPEGTPPEKCAAVFVNPLTALSMIDVLHREGHKALVHTAAASNLGQMLVKLCEEDGIPLINIVRRDDQAQILRKLGAHYILDSASPDFNASLIQAVRETGATLAFDAIGGGTMATTILNCMEKVYAPEEFYIYGSNVHKQIYLYGMLDTSPTQIIRAAGMAWSISGFLIMNYLSKRDADTIQAMKDRIVRQLDSNFVSHFTAELSLGDMLDNSKLEAMAQRSTGEKYLLNPSLG